jgi:predicted CXXCH cytochrome family protein
MMRKVLFLSVAVMAMAGLAGAQTVVGSAHDLSTGSGGTQDATTQQVCVFCHTPHQDTGTLAPLWNHVNSLSAVADYGVYTGLDLQAAPTAVAPNDGSVTSLCMTCHDGTVAVDSLHNDPNDGLGGVSGGGVDASGIVTGAVNVGEDLSNDHPVNFTYDTALDTADGELADPTSAAVIALLTSTTATGGDVQCSSCHDPHNGSGLPAFVPVTMVGSQLCLVCHEK